MESRSRPQARELSRNAVSDPDHAPVSGREAPGRLGTGRPVAIIDIGSNSVRLVAYEGLTRALTPLYNEKVLCGLGRSVATTGRLDDEAVERALKALRRFRLLCAMMGATRVWALATAAARDASNGQVFLAAAAAACGQPIQLLSGAREAQLAAAGVVAGFYAPDGIVGDLGGGSLELVDVKGDTVRIGTSLRIGGLALQDLSGNSPKKARKIVREALATAEQLRRLEGRTFYAVGGTWRALARLQQAERGYPLRVAHGYRIDPEDNLGFLSLLEEADADALKAIESISEARRPLLAYGAIVLEEIIRAGRPVDIAISALGVREGLLYEQLDPEARALDPLIEAANEFNLLRSRSPGHGEDMRAWTDLFVRSLGLPESAAERRHRQAACLLADIGWRAHPDYRGEQSFNIIANANFVAINHPGRAYLALSVFFRHEGLSPDRVSPQLLKVAGPHLVERARLLAALMRVAYPISVAMAGVLPRTPLVARNGTIVLSLPRDMAALASERLTNRLRQLSRLVGRDARIELV